MKREWRVSMSWGRCIMRLFLLVQLLFHLVIMPSGARELSLQPQPQGDCEVHDAVNFLMTFKQSSVQSDPKGFLSDWSHDGDPCSWHAVSCSPDGQVTVLNLSNAGVIGSLNLPLLTALPTLQHLYLQGNSFSAANLNVSTSSSSCTSLQTLDLSSNNLSEPFLLLSPCSCLAYLNLSRNSIPGATLRFGPSLVQLDLSRNHISDSSLLTYTLSNCHNLNLFNFSDNQLTGKLGSITPMSCKDLSVLDLSYNLLSWEIPPRFLADSPASLLYLDLSYNNFSGSFSALNFGSCPNLTSLFLAHNILAGDDFPLSLEHCQHLETLNLSHNQLRSKIPGSLLGNFKRLKQLSLAHNHFSGEIPPELAELCGTLQELDLSANKLSGELPSSFASCSSLLDLNLGNNQLSGDFLSTVVSKLQSLIYLYVPFNNITGPVPLSLTNCSHLRVLDLSSNTFSGKVPGGLCPSTGRSGLEKILLASNFLSGTVPSELGNCKNLRSIDLSFNSLSGPIPSEIWNLPNLSDMVMWANNLTGGIPEGICVDGGNLETLILNNNLIHGTIPQSIAKCTNMIWVSLASNRLTGNIPAGSGNLLNLAILQLGNNSLTGQIPPELGKCQSLIWLDLNSNNLSGSVPSELANQAGLVFPGRVSGKQFAFVRNEGGTACRGAGGLVEIEGIRRERLENFPMVHACPSTRIYSGMTVYTFSSNGSFIYLDLSYNSLSGNIPESFGSMNYLQVLNLGHNKLTGKIPDSFGGLKEIGVLDLSHNSLQGFVPGSLGVLSFLSDLDVSNNNLTGPIPSGGQLTTFPASRYENNPELCGLPLQNCASLGPPRAETKKEENGSGIDWFYIFMSIGYATSQWGVLGIMWYNNKWREAYFSFVHNVKERTISVLRKKEATPSRTSRSNQMESSCDDGDQAEHFCLSEDSFPRPHFHSSGYCTLFQVSGHIKR